MVCIGRKRQRGNDELDAPQKDDRKRDAQDIQCVCVCVCVLCRELLRYSSRIFNKGTGDQRKKESREMRRKLVSGRHCRNKFNVAQ